MRVLVLNGSPKGKVSVTMQYVHLAADHLPGHDFEIVNVSQKIRKLDKDPEAFDALLEKIRDAGAVLFATPVYYFLVPAQYKRFIELLDERGGKDALQGKYAASLTTSIHVLDHTAHNYLRGVCEDLGANFFGSFSPDMDDILKKEERKNLLTFFQDFLNAAENQLPASRAFAPMKHRKKIYRPQPPAAKVETKGARVLVIADELPEKGNLKILVDRFMDALDGPADLAVLSEMDIKGGCIGCIRCGYDNSCQYDGQDGFRDFYEKKVKPADVLVFAGTMKDRYLSSTWKTYFDRSFYNGHCPSLTGKQMGLLISGPLSQNHNLREILTSYVQMMEANLIDTVTDEPQDPAVIDGLLDQLARRLVRHAKTSFASPPLCVPVGVMNMFRNEIGGRLQFVFRADHLFYKDRGYYKIPQKGPKAMLMNWTLGPLNRLPAFRKKFYQSLTREMIRPYEMVVKKEKNRELG